MKYEKMCRDILTIVKKDNIQDVFYCVTRLRLSLKDINAVDKEALAKIDGIIQVKEVGNQLQLVVGSHVQKVYEEFCQIAEINQNDPVAESKAETVKASGGSIPSRILDTLSSIFLPILPLFVAGGMLKSLVLILTVFNIVPNDNGVVIVLNAIGDVPFYFLPFMVGYTTAKRFKLS